MPTDRNTAYQLALQIQQEHAVPVFPVRLSQNPSGKWQKKPLCKWSKSSESLDNFHWRDANGVGVPMGRRSGLLTIDLDIYKDGSAALSWVARHDLPATRIHQTVSGGQHLIFRLPVGCDLGNHAPSVEGLDVRGDGGFIVWADTAERYSVLDYHRPALLPSGVCDELLALQKGRGKHLSDKDLPDWHPVDESELQRKLKKELDNPFRRELAQRFSGSTAYLNDKSASAMDMSLASLLASRGFNYSEIFSVLMQHFHHGSAARDGWTEKTERGALRCAARSISQVEDKSAERLSILAGTLKRRCSTKSAPSSAQNDLGRRL
jgi:hypothetical protein